MIFSTVSARGHGTRSTNADRPYTTRVLCKFKGKEGQVVLDQIRTVDKVRLVKRMGRLSRRKADEVIEVLSELFAR